MIKNRCLKDFERLKGKKNIQNIFQNGIKNYKYFINFIYLNHEKINITKIGVFVPKHFLKKSVDRNTIKRLIKNSYRLNKYILNKKKYHIIFFYKHKILVNYNYINLIMKKILKYLTKID